MEIRKEIVAIVDSLGKKGSHLTQVDLNLVGISDSELGYLINPLLRSKSVTTLILSNNNITQESMPFLAELLKKSKTIRAVYLNYNKLEAKGAQALAAAVAVNETLTSLDLWHCSIGDVGATALCNALLSNRKTQVVSLDLATNELSDDTGIKLAECLSQNMPLRYLRLNGNQLTDKSGKALAEALLHNTVLDRLELARNNLTDKSASAIANNLLKKAKHDTQSLRVLDFSDIPGITDTTAEKLANLLIKDHRLETIRLSGCTIGDGGAAALFVALGSNQTLRQLDLSHTLITGKSLPACIEMLKVNVILCSLNLPDTVRMDATAKMHLAFNNALYQYLVSYRSVLARFQDAINSRKSYGDLAKQYAYECEELLRFLRAHRMDPVVQEKCNNLYKQCLAEMQWAQKELKKQSDVTELKITELLKNELEPKPLTLPVETVPAQPAAVKIGVFGLFGRGEKVDPVQKNINQVVAELLGSLLKPKVSKPTKEADYFTDIFSLLADLLQGKISSLELLQDKYAQLHLEESDWKRIYIIQKILQNTSMPEDVPKRHLRQFLPEGQEVSKENYQKIRQGLINGLQWHIDHAETTKQLIIDEVPSRTVFYIRNFIGQAHENLHVELLKALRSHELIRAGVPLPKEFPEDVFVIEMTGLMREMLDYISEAKKSTILSRQPTEVTMLMVKYRHLRLGFKEWEMLELLKAILESEKLPESPIVAGKIKDKFLPQNVQLNRETYHIIRQSLISEVLSLIEELPKMILPAKELSEQEKEIEIEKKKEPLPIVVDQETIERQIPFLVEIYLGKYIALLMPLSGDLPKDFYAQTAKLYADLLKIVNQSIESRTEVEERALRALLVGDPRMKDLYPKEKNELILAILSLSHVELPKSHEQQQLLQQLLPEGAPLTDDNYQLIRQAFIEQLSHKIAQLEKMAQTIPESNADPKTPGSTPK